MLDNTNPIPSHLTDSDIQESFIHIANLADSLTFSIESVLEIGSLKIQAERHAKAIKEKRLKKYCLIELSELNTDEFYDMFTQPTESSFFSAQHEFIQVLRDCHRGPRY
jgi:hypothetical protein